MTGTVIGVTKADAQLNDAKQNGVEDELVEITDEQQINNQKLQHRFCHGNMAKADMRSCAIMAAL